MTVTGVRLALPGLVLALALAACATSEARGESVGLAHAPALTDLGGGAWVADNILDPKVSLVPGSRITMTFHDGSLSAKAGCNTMRGHAAIDDGHLVVTAVASTLKGCSDALSRQDAWLSKFLASRPSIERQKQDLWLTRHDTTVNLVQD
jgi:heat shock protein HslJ